MSIKPKILMIDDAAMMHGIVKARLLADGLDFYSSFNGSEGLSLALAIQPDTILLDVDMPSPDGFEVCRRLKAEPALSNIPVIFLTGMSSTEEKIRGLNLGAIDYITKPFDAAELQARVRVSLRIKELHDLLSKKAMIDGLTGLYNRGFLNQRLKEEMAYVARHHRQMAVIMLDVDHFKSINDTHGHGFGDMVLKGVASILQQVSRTEDITCRFGGEEFAILARETDAIAAMAFAERLRRGVESATFSRGPISVSVTCSLGIAGSDDGIESIIDRADQALYDSKRAGRNRSTLFTALATAA